MIRKISKNEIRERIHLRIKQVSLVHKGLQPCQPLFVDDIVVNNFLKV